MPIQAFGEWDAPMTDDADWIEVPIGQLCMFCQLAFDEGDNGAIQPNGFGMHRECALRSSMGGIGHLVDHERYCRDIGPDAGLSYRESAKLVWRWFVHGEHITKAELDEIRKGSQERKADD